MIQNKLSTGGGALILNVETLNKINGFSNLYSGWGSEDSDLTWRLFLNNINVDCKYMIDRLTNNSEIIEELKFHEREVTDTEKKEKIQIGSKNNIILIQQIINYSLVFYYENKDKFNKSDNKIYYKEKLFFEGKFNNKFLESGKLYDLLSTKNDADFIKNDNVIIYEGMLLNGLPTGLGKVYSLWGNIALSGLFLNGYIFKSIPNHEYNQHNTKEASPKYLFELQFYKHLDVTNTCDFKLYKNYVYNGLKDNTYNFKVEKHENNVTKLLINTETNNKFCNLHFSKKLNASYDFIKDDLQLNGFESINSDNILEKKQIGSNTLYYFDKKWQYPVITEKRVFEIYVKYESIPENYFAFPWATLIDEIYHKKSTSLLNFILHFKHTHSTLFTVCQHISFRRLLPLFKHIGITHVFASHCSHNDYLLEEKYNLKILPHSLYPVNDCIINTENTNKYLCSFIGSYDKNCYLNDVRDRLNILGKYNDCVINIKNKWHFHDIVYEKQINDNNINLDHMKNNEMEYSELLLNTTFSLCPNGTGPNTIRFWESLSYGCIPVLLSNEHKLPNFIHWDDICILYNDRDITELYKYLKSFTKTDIELRSKKCKQVFNEYFSKENFYKTIENYFNN